MAAGLMRGKYARTLASGPSTGRWLVRSGLKRPAQCVLSCCEPRPSLAKGQVFSRSAAGRRGQPSLMGICLPGPIASILPFCPQEAGDRFCRKRFRRFLGLVLCTLALAAALGPLRPAKLSLIRDRRAEYPDMSSSIAYMSFWILMLAAMFWRWRWVMNAFHLLLVFGVLCLAAPANFLRAYGARRLALFLP